MQLKMNQPLNLPIIKKILTNIHQNNMSELSLILYNNTLCR